MKTTVQRRRFYLSESALETIDKVASQNDTTPSIILDVLILQLEGEGYFKQFVIKKEV